MKTKTAYAIWFAVLLSFSKLVAQESAGQRHEMATNQLKRLAAEMTGQCLNGVLTLDQWKEQQPALRRQLLDMLGLDPLPKRTQLKAHIACLNAI